MRLTIPFHYRSTQTAHRPSMRAVALWALPAVALSCGQASQVETLETKSAALTAPTDPLTFESASDWHVTQSHVRSLTITTARTQGNGALAVAAPQNYTRLDSNNLSSTNPELATLDVGSKVSLDFLLPTVQANPFWFGAVQMFMTAPSRNVYNAYLGQIELTGMRTGIFTTLHFTIPDVVITALKGKTYSDLVFGIVINVPSNTTGTYILDNLRLKSAKLPARPTNVSQISAGSSIQLEASKTYSPPASTVASQTFAAGVIQIPQSFHVFQGSAGTGSATFEFALGTATPVLCQYPASGASTYAFSSCANGARAGDLVPASFVRLTIVNGDATAGKTKVKAQIALNPVGDELPTGLPAIPTFFGTSASEVRAALDAFVQAQLNWKIDGDVVVRTPTPAIPIGFPVTRNGTVISTPAADNDPPFSISSRITGTDLADAGWHVNGSIAAPVDAAGNRDTHFDIDVGVDAWLLGLSANDVLGVTGQVDTHTPATDGKSIPPTTESAKFCFVYFGVGQSCAGPFNGSTGLNVPLFHTNPTIPFFSIDYWVFHVASSAAVAINADLTGGFTPTGGFSIAVDPSLSLSAHLEGGVSLGVFAGGGLFADVQLIGMDVPVSASVNTSVNVDPRVCSVTASETFSAKANISSGGGTVGYYLEGGLCCGCFIDVCWRDEGNIFSWSGLSTSFDILPNGSIGSQTFPLPTAVCAPTGGPDGGMIYPIAGEGFNAGDVSFIQAAFSRTFQNGGPFNVPSFFDCSDFTWSSSDPSDVISALPNSPTSNGPCYTRIKYGTAGSRSISVTAIDPALGTGLASVNVTVTGDPTTAPSVTATSPPAFAVAPNCGPLQGTASATDPNNLAVTFEWLVGAEPPLSVFSLGTGPSLALGENGGNLVRLVGTNSAGQAAIDEIPVQFTCIK